jgi:hypothetical protein
LFGNGLCWKINSLLALFRDCFSKIRKTILNSVLCLCVIPSVSQTF